MTRVARPRRRLAALFAGLTAAAVGVVLGALWVGWMRTQVAGAANGFIAAAVISCVGVAGVMAAAWLALDDRVAKPVERIAAGLRIAAEGGAEAGRSPHAAPDLGDLGPAAAVAAAALSDQTAAAAARVATATERLSAERDALESLLCEIPLAILMVGPDDRIILYDGQAAEVMEQVAPPRLDAPVTDYIDPASLAEGKRHMREARAAVSAVLRTRGGALRIDARLAPLGDGAYMVVAERSFADLAKGAARPLVHGLARRDTAPVDGPMDQRPLATLSYAVVDLETTGLLPHADAIVQVGAVRVSDGRIVPGETFERLVHPGRPIPAASTAVHGIRDVDVDDADLAEAVLPRLHAFCDGCVFVAHNAPFDLGFLRRTPSASPCNWTFPTLDTALLSAVVFGAAEEHTLDALAARLGLPVGEGRRHTAPGDAMLTANVLLRLIPILEARGIATFGAAVRECRLHGRMLRDMNG